MSPKHCIPTDLDLLCDAREKSEQLIDSIYDIKLHETKPRTDRMKARKEYFRVAQNKKKTKKKIRNAIRKQLGYLHRNIRSINRLLDAYPQLPFDRYERKYFYVIQTLLAQQLTMYLTHTHTIDGRIVSIHQPHVRPIVRGKQWLLSLWSVSLSNCRNIGFCGVWRQDTGVHH